MAIRTITWTVDEDMQVTPTRVQNAGVQGDDNATRVVFSLPAFLQEGYTLYIEHINAVNEWDKTDPLAVTDGAVGCDLPLAWTQHGGEATVRLVAEQDGVVAYTAKGRVRYDGRAKAFAKIKSLIEGSIQAAQDRIAKMIADAKVWIDNVNGVYVGGGDMPDSAVIQIDPEGEALLLDNAMSDTSENVPKTKVVKAYVDKIAKESTSYSGCFYRTVGGVTEWLNPPMLARTEYRTVERYHGKPVYVQEFHLPELPNVAYETYDMLVNNVDQVRSATLTCVWANSGKTYTYATSKIMCMAGVDDDNRLYISIDSPEDASGSNGFVTVKYTKTTD